MADGLLSSALNLIDRAKQSVKSNVGLLMSNPQEFAAQKTAQYFPTKDEEMQYQAVEQAGGDVTQTPYYQKLFNLSQFQGSIKGIPKTQYDIAQEVAQKNATEMLGLPPNNTAMDRAKALGFDTPVYHATSADFGEFVPNSLRGASYMARTPEGAMRGAAAGTADRFGQGVANRVMPLLTRSSDVEGLTISKVEKKWFDKLPKEANESQVTKLMDSAPKNGYWFVWYDEIQMPNGTFKYVKKPEPKITYEQAEKTGRDYLGRSHGDYSDASTERFTSEMTKQQGKGAYLQNDESGLAMAVVDPAILRSRFAAFDPAKINESDLLAAGVPLGLLAGAEQVVKTPEKKKPKK